jgi:hypothetical protein
MDETPSLYPRLPQNTDIEPLLQWVDHEKVFCTKCGQRQTGPKKTRLSWKRSGFWVAIVASLLLLAIGTGNIVLTYFKPCGYPTIWYQYLTSGLIISCAIALLINTRTPDRVSLII